MTAFSKGKYAQFISDRSGQAFPYTEMVKEWNGARVHISEFEPKQPQLQPKPVGADAQGLPEARPARVEPATTIIAPENSISATSGSGTMTITMGPIVNSTLEAKVADTNPYQTGDVVRISDLQSNIGGLTIDNFQTETTLASNISASATTISLTDASKFPTSGYIVIQKVLTSSDTSDPVQVGNIADEVIQYTGKSSNDLTGCTRGTSGIIYGVRQPTTTAGTHSSGAKVFGSFVVTRLTRTVGSVSYSCQFTFNTVSNATATDSGSGGTTITTGPVNIRRG